MESAIDDNSWVSSFVHGDNNGNTTNGGEMVSLDNGGGDDYDYYFDDFAYFSNAQYVGLFVIGMTSSLLSIAGSCIILYLVFGNKNTNELYHRLLCGLSLSDLLMTSTLILQPILVPRETGYIFAIGKQATCSFLGFGYLFFVASYAYNFMLGIYFLATVRYRIPQDKIAKYMEPYGHVMAFCMPIAIGSSALYFDMFNTNPFLGACTLFPTDHECTWQDDLPCENDQAHTVLNNVLDFYAMGLVFVGLVCTGMVYWTVKRNFGSRGSPTDFDNPEQVDITQRKRTQTIAMQAVWYAVAYFVGLLVVVVANIVYGIFLEDSLMDLGDSGVYYFMLCLLWFLFPLQGFLNCLIYIRPRLVRWKHHYEDASWWFAFQKVLTRQVPPRWGAPTVSIESETKKSTTLSHLERLRNKFRNNHKGSSARSIKYSIEGQQANTTKKSSTSSSLRRSGGDSAKVLPLSSRTPLATPGYSSGSAKRSSRLSISLPTIEESDLDERSAHSIRRQVPAPPSSNTSNSTSSSHSELDSPPRIRIQADGSLVPVAAAAADVELDISERIIPPPPYLSNTNNSNDTMNNNLGGSQGSLRVQADGSLAPSTSFRAATPKFW